MISPETEALAIAEADVSSARVLQIDAIALRKQSCLRGKTNLGPCLAATEIPPGETVLRRGGGGGGTNGLGGVTDLVSVTEETCRAFS
jgi:hypothetical protein